MSLRRIDVILLAGLIMSLLLTWTAGRDFSRPNYEFMPDMAHSIAYDAFAPNANFRDGKTLQQPPAGSIARGLMPLHYQATPEDAQRAGDELHSPFPLDDAAALQRGALVFSRFCQQCHGPAGEGDGPVAKRGFPPPPSLLLDNTRQMKDGQVFHVLTYGQGNMPSHAGQLSRDDRWNAVAHVRSLQRRPVASQPAPATQPDTKSDAQPDSEPDLQPAVPTFGDTTP